MAENKRDCPSERKGNTPSTERNRGRRNYEEFEGLNNYEQRRQPYRPQQASHTEEVKPTGTNRENREQSENPA